MQECVHVTGSRPFSQLLTIPPTSQRTHSPLFKRWGRSLIVQHENQVAEGFKKGRKKTAWNSFQTSKSYLDLIRFVLAAAIHIHPPPPPPRDHALHLSAQAEPTQWASVTSVRDTDVTSQAFGFTPHEIRTIFV